MSNTCPKCNIELDRGRCQRCGMRVILVTVDPWINGKRRGPIHVYPDGSYDAPNGMTLGQAVLLTSVAFMGAAHPDAAFLERAAEILGYNEEA